MGDTSSSSHFTRAILLKVVSCWPVTFETNDHWSKTSSSSCEWEWWNGNGTPFPLPGARSWQYNLAESTKLWEWYVATLVHFWLGIRTNACPLFSSVTSCVLALSHRWHSEHYELGDKSANTRTGPQLAPGPDIFWHRGDMRQTWIFANIWWEEILPWP